MESYINMFLLTLLAVVTVAIIRQRSLFGVVVLASIYSFLMASVMIVLDAVDVAMTDPTTHDEVKAEHDRVIDAGGFGVPTLFFGDQAIFGPVLLDPPSGEAALRMWSAVTAWVEFPHLYEIQRPKSGDDHALIADTFRPYLEARDWVSINRGKVVDFDDTKSSPGA